MSEAQVESPLATYISYCKRGELGYQVGGDGSAVFYPRLVSPKTAKPDLKWKVSSGLGTVYATSTVHQRDQQPYNVALIDVDEGFRMMSRVEDIAPDDVKVGMRVKVRMHPGGEKQAPYPVLVPLEASR